MKTLSLKEKVDNILAMHDNIGYQTDETDEVFIELNNVRVRDAVIYEAYYKGKKFMENLSDTLTYLYDRIDVDDKSTAAFMMIDVALVTLMYADIHPSQYNEDVNDDEYYTAVHNMVSVILDYDKDLSLAHQFKMMVDNKVPAHVFRDSVTAISKEELYA